MSPAVADSARTRAEAGDSTVLEVAIPGQSHYVEVLRGVSARVGHIAGFTYDGVEDLALAMTEAASIVMRSGARRVEALLVVGPDAVQIQVHGTGMNGQWPVSGLRTNTSWQILEALCDELRLLDDGVSFRQTRR